VTRGAGRYSGAPTASQPRRLPRLYGNPGCGLAAHTLYLAFGREFEAGRPVGQLAEARQRSFDAGELSAAWARHPRVDSGILTRYERQRRAGELASELAPGDSLSFLHRLLHYGRRRRPETRCPSTADRPPGTCRYRAQRHRKQWNRSAPTRPCRASKAVEPERCGSGELGAWTLSRKSRRESARPPGSPLAPNPRGKQRVGSTSSQHG
jgi:hypothetical protein